MQIRGLFTWKYEEGFREKSLETMYSDSQNSEKKKHVGEFCRTCSPPQSLLFKSFTQKHILNPTTDTPAEIDCHIVVHMNRFSKTLLFNTLFIFWGGVGVGGRGSIFKAVTKERCVHVPLHPETCVFPFYPGSNMDEVFVYNPFIIISLFMSSRGRTSHRSLMPNTSHLMHLRKAE